MTEPAQAWGRDAAAYRRMIKGSRPTFVAYKQFVDAVKLVANRDSGRACRVLDVASGHGEPAFTLIDQLPGVDVTLTDFAEARICWKFC